MDFGMTTLIENRNYLSYLNKNSPSTKSVGGNLELEMDSGVIATITAQEDGWVTIRFSDRPGRSTRTRIDDFLKNYR